MYLTKKNKIIYNNFIKYLKIIIFIQISQKVLFSCKMASLYSTFSTIDEIYDNDKYDEFEENINSFLDSIDVFLTFPEDKN